MSGELVVKGRIAQDLATMELAIYMWGSEDEKRRQRLSTMSVAKSMYIEI